ncbi:hypothetical protein CRENBAI_001173 [Crenichthys baileyi]|uniref:Uncharacterized protein n=1 Tax=Crenichthys baileyi TaxID=28760 RepID=A0AAV9RH16_9TELE
MDYSGGEGKRDNELQEPSGNIYFNTDYDHKRAKIMVPMGITGTFRSLEMELQSLPSVKTAAKMGQTGIRDYCGLPWWAGRFVGQGKIQFELNCKKKKKKRAVNHGRFSSFFC